MRTSSKASIVAVCGFLAVPLISLSSFAQQPATDELPRLLCTLDTATRCTDAASCKPVQDLDGAKLPLKMTMDARNSAVAFPEGDGWVTVTKILTAARSADQLILQGIDGPVSWHVMIYEKKQANGRLLMSLGVASADAATVGFGTCAADG